MLTHAPETQVKSGQGKPLDDTTRSLFERRLNHDFSRVRIHADSAAGKSAAAVNAKAYTVGRDLVFAPGEYAPYTGAGQKLLAHELAHVVQQSRGGGAPAPLPNNELEKSADRASSEFMLGGHAVTVRGASGIGIARVFAPTSLSGPLDPSSMFEESIRREIELITHWLKDNPNSPEVGRLATNLASLKEELGRRPAKAAAGPGGTGATDRRGFAELRFPVPMVKEPAPPAAEKRSQPENPGINTPPPTTKSPSIESMLPPSPDVSRSSPLDRDLLGLGGAGAPGKKKEETKATQPPTTQTATTAKPEADDEKKGLGLQTGTGMQTGIRAPHGAFQYVQVSAEYSNAYVVSLEKDKLPGFLKGNLDSISFLGEPGWTLQHHVLGDQPGTLDLQFLLKLVQFSLKRVDISIVAGEQFADIGSKWDSSRFTPLAGLETETKIVSAGPVSLTWVLDGLAALPQKHSAPDILGRTTPLPGRDVDGQFSGELRLKLLWDIGGSKPSEKKPER